MHFSRCAVDFFEAYVVQRRIKVAQEAHVRISDPTFRPYSPPVPIISYFAARRFDQNKISEESGQLAAQRLKLQ
jgi:CDP-glycerol glycerophosphotransferase (TagB/SpsB family)